MIQEIDTLNVKIGYAINIEKRLNELQVGNSSELKIINSFEGARILERHIQNYFWGNHIRGEWFKFDKEMLSLNIETMPKTMKYHKDRGIEAHYRKLLKEILTGNQFIVIDELSVPKTFKKRPYVIAAVNKYNKERFGTIFLKTYKRALRINELYNMGFRADKIPEIMGITPDQFRLSRRVCMNNYKGAYYLKNEPLPDLSSLRNNNKEVELELPSLFDN